MADFIVCDKNKVSYLDIRKAMIKGMRTKGEINNTAGTCGSCQSCETSLEWILSTVCRCRAVPLKAVVDAVKNGADTVEKVGTATKAGTADDCGKCKILIENIIELKK